MTASTSAAPTAGAAHRILDASGVLPFADIVPADVVAAADVVLADGEALLARIEAGTAPTTDLMDQLEHHGDRFDRTYWLAQHFQALCDSPEWRSAWAEVQPRLTDFQSRWGQSRAVFTALDTLRTAGGHSPERQRLLDSMVLEMRLAGVALDGADQERFRANQSELAALGTRFAQTALDARKAWSHTVTDPTEVAGLPLNWRRMTAASAEAAGHPGATADEGPWRVTLDRPVADPVLEHAVDRSLRERVRRAWLRVGADAPHDNSPTMARILELRQAQASLLGFGSYIELSMARKMAGGADKVHALIDRVVEAAGPGGAAELAHVQGLAAAAGAEEAHDWRVWDERFWAERDRETQVGLTDADLRPYFAFEAVRAGLFALVERLFGVRIEAAPERPVWHPDARAYQLTDVGADRPRAFLYIDPYARPETKRAGAWMMPLVGRSRLLGGPDGPRRPAAAICCNQTPPVGDTPSLMSFRQVTTLFHEMGHALHHLLTEADDSRQAGVSGVEWDAVELPSMFLECWVYHRPTLQSLARHHETGEPLSEAAIERLVAARAHRGATHLLGQSAYTRLDLAVHEALTDHRPEHVHAIGTAALAATRTTPPLPGDRMLCSFSHLFAGGYAAGYYSYMWAGVLARDAFAAFVELDGDPDAEAALGRRWRHEVLAPGGSVHPMALFQRFRGRGPDVTAILEWYGVAA